MRINPTKKYQTRDGREVLAVFVFPQNNPSDVVVAHVVDWHPNRTVEARHYTEDGCFLDNDQSGWDLIEVV